MPSKTEKRERLIAQIKRQRALEDEAFALGAELRAVAGEKARVEQEMKDLARAAEPGQITNLARCLKVHRTTVHRWRER